MKTWQVRMRDENRQEDLVNAPSVADVLREVEAALKEGCVVIEIREMRPIGGWPSPQEGA
jgi:hypothetical protein